MKVRVRRSSVFEAFRWDGKDLPGVKEFLGDCFVKTSIELRGPRATEKVTHVWFQQLRGELGHEIAGPGYVIAKITDNGPTHFRPIGPTEWQARWEEVE